MSTTHPIQRSTAKYVPLFIGILLFIAPPATWASSESGGTFSAVATDTQDLQTEIENVIFYYEEKVSETAFIPHELRELPVKRGTSTVKIKFNAMKQIELKASEDGAPPVATVTLKDGKSGEFQLAMAGTFKGESAFGEVELPASQLSRVVFK